MSTSQNPEEVQEEGQQSSLQTEDTDKDQVIAELRNQNALILEQFGQLRNFVTSTIANTPAKAPVETPAPTFTGNDLLERPTEVIGDVAERKILPHLNKMRDDILAQIRPANESVMRNDKEKAVDTLVTNMKNNRDFSHINNPKVEQVFRSLVMGATQVDQNTVVFAYRTAVGDAVLSGDLTSSNSTPSVPNTPTSKSPVRSTPFVPPSGGRAPAGNLPQLPALDDNALKIMKERGWSHARMAFGLGLITREEYKKYEPDGKIPDNFDNQQFVRR